MQNNPTAFGPTNSYYPPIEREACLIPLYLVENLTASGSASFFAVDGTDAMHQYHAANGTRHGDQLRVTLLPASRLKRL